MDARVVLIGGSSNIGKSTLARALAHQLGWTNTSTDSLARHPGRPWPVGVRAVPPHVAEHYLSLAVDELIASVLRHYETMWPMIEDLVRTHLEAADGLMLEGSALWPASVATLGAPMVSAVWLTGDEALFTARIRRESRYQEADATGRAMIDKFLARTLEYDRRMMDVIVRLGLPSIRVEDGFTVEELAQACLTDMRPLG